MQLIDQNLLSKIEEQGKRNLRQASTQRRSVHRRQPSYSGGKIDNFRVLTDVAANMLLNPTLEPFETLASRTEQKSHLTLQQGHFSPANQSKDKIDMQKIRIQEIVDLNSSTFRKQRFSHVEAQKNNQAGIEQVERNKSQEYGYFSQGNQKRKKRLLIEEDQPDLAMNGQDKSDSILPSIQSQQQAQLVNSNYSTSYQKSDYSQSRFQKKIKVLKNEVEQLRQVDLNDLNPSIDFDPDHPSLKSGGAKMRRNGEVSQEEDLRKVDGKHQRIQSDHISKKKVKQFQVIHPSVAQIASNQSSTRSENFENGLMNRKIYKIQLSDIRFDSETSRDDVLMKNKMQLKNPKYKPKLIMNNHRAIFSPKTPKQGEQHFGPTRHITDQEAFRIHQKQAPLKIHQIAERDDDGSPYLRKDEQVKRDQPSQMSQLGPVSSVVQTEEYEMASRYVENPGYKIIEDNIALRSLTPSKHRGMLQFRTEHKQVDRLELQSLDQNEETSTVKSLAGLEEDCPSQCQSTNKKTIYINFSSDRPGEVKGIQVKTEGKTKEQDSIRKKTEEDKSGGQFVNGSNQFKLIGNQKRPIMMNQLSQKIAINYDTGPRGFIPSQKNNQLKQQQLQQQVYELLQQKREPSIPQVPLPPHQQIMVGAEKYHPGYPPVVKQIVDPKAKPGDLKFLKGKKTDQKQANLNRAQMLEFQERLQERLKKDDKSASKTGESESPTKDHDPPILHVHMPPKLMFPIQQPLKTISSQSRQDQIKTHNELDYQQKRIVQKIESQEVLQKQLPLQQQISRKKIQKDKSRNTMLPPSPEKSPLKTQQNDKTLKQLMSRQAKKGVAQSKMQLKLSPTKKKKQKNQDNLSVQQLDGVSSDTAESVKEIRFGHEIGSRVKLTNSTFNKDYLSASTIAQKYKSMFTPAKYFALLENKDGSKRSYNSSERLYVGKEFVERFETRRQLPVLILNMDGALGYWDNLREMYILRHKVFENLPNLSQDFIIIAVSHQPKFLIQRVIEQMQKLMVLDSPNSYPPVYNQKVVTFDLVYQLKSEVVKMQKYYTMNGMDNHQTNWQDLCQSDLTQALLDSGCFNQPEPDPKYKILNEFYYDDQALQSLSKVMVVTVKKSLFQNVSYSFDYQNLFYITQPKLKKFRKLVPKLDDLTQTPVAITVPHMRQNHKISFDLVTLAIVTTLGIAVQNARVHMENIIIRNKFMRESNIKQMQRDLERLEEDIEQIAADMEEEGEPSEFFLKLKGDAKEFQDQIKEQEESLAFEGALLEQIQVESEVQGEYTTIQPYHLMKKMISSTAKKVEKRVKNFKLHLLRMIKQPSAVAFKLLMYFLNIQTAFKVMKKHVNLRRTNARINYDWIQFKTYKLKFKDSTQNQGMHGSYVSNIEQPHTKAIAEWQKKMELLEAQAQSLAAAGPYAPIKGPVMPHHYADNEEAKNLFNHLMSHNRHIQKEVTTYRDQYKASLALKDNLYQHYKHHQSDMQTPNLLGNTENKSKKSASVSVCSNNGTVENQAAQSKHQEASGSSPEPKREIEINVEAPDVSPNPKLSQKSLKESIVNKSLSHLSAQSISLAKQTSATRTRKSLSCSNSKNLLMKEDDKKSSNKAGSRDKSKSSELKQDDSMSGKEEGKNPDSESNDEEEEVVETQQKESNLSSKRQEQLLKYRAINVKPTWDNIEHDNTAPQLTNSNTGEIELKNFILISLRKDVYSSICERETPIEKDELYQLCSSVGQQKKLKNPLVALLAQKQRIVPFSTTQDLHLANNLSQLVGGEQQYYDQLQQSTQQGEKGK